MMKRHPEVGQHTVHTLHVVIAHEVSDEAEVAVNHRETRVILGRAAHGVHILVEGVEVSTLGSIHTFHDGT